MFIEISGGQSGIAEYLRDGRKKDREFSREQLDKRITLSGDLDVTDSIIKNLDFKENYHHITLSFKEDYVSEKDLKKASDEFEKFIKAAYKDSELNYYTEAHIPKLKSYKSKSGELVIRKPHIHIVIPNINLENGKYIEPLGFVKRNIQYTDAFKELHNEKFGFESPKNNMNNEFNRESTIIAREKGDIFDRNKTEKEEILNHILENKISNYKEFKDYLETQGTVKVRNAKKENSYFNLKVEHHSQGMNLKEFCFSKEFIEEYSYEGKIDFLQEKSEEKFIERKEAYTSKQTDKYEQNLKDWFDYRAKEIKYINYDSKYYKEKYKHLSRYEKIEAVNILEKEFYSKLNLRKEIELELSSSAQFAHGELNIEFETNQDNEVSQKINDLKEEKELKNIDFTGLDMKKVYEILKQEKGVTDVKFKLNKDEQLIDCGSNSLNANSFLVEMMNFSANEIHHLQESILKIEHDIISNKGSRMSINVNIQTNDRNNNKVDYYQLGIQDVAGRFTGVIHDKASELDTARAYVINDKVVSLKDFKKNQKEMFKEIENKTKDLFVQNTSIRYNEAVRMDVMNTDVSLTAQGSVYAHSKYNMKELTPIQMGVSGFDKKLDKNFFTIAKEFITAKEFRDNFKVKVHEFKDKVKSIITSKPELAASNVSMAIELKELKQKLDLIKTYQDAIEMKSELRKESIQSQSSEYISANNVKDNPKKIALIKELEDTTCKMRIVNVLNNVSDYLGEKDRVFFVENYENNLKLKEEYLDKLQNQQHVQSEQKEFSFKEVYSKVKELGEKIEDANEIKELATNENFIDKRNTAIELIGNIKENPEQSKLTENDLSTLNLSQAKAANMMFDNNIEISSLEGINKFVDVLKSCKNMADTQNLDFENIVNLAVQKLPELNQNKTQQKNNEVER